MSWLFHRILDHAHNLRDPGPARPLSPPAGPKVSDETFDEPTAYQTTSAQLPAPALGRDNRPSIRMLLVPALLSQGRSTAEIAATTGVPSALIELITEERRAAGTFDPFVPTPPHNTTRRSHVMMVMIVFVAAANAATAMTSVLVHSQALGAASLVGSMLLTLTVFAFARRSRPSTGPVAGRKPHH